MSDPITIDNYNVEIHKRWATDQKALDRTYTVDGHLVSRHLEAAVADTVMPSKWEELFEAESGFHTWALFSPPPSYKKMRNRFFSSSGISTGFIWEEEEEKEGEKEEEGSLSPNLADQIRKKIENCKKGSLSPSLFEKEQKALLYLVNSIQALNGLLREAHARKLQYQKG